jgi:hypothetical protein
MAALGEPAAAAVASPDDLARWVTVVAPWPAACPAQAAQAVLSGAAATAHANLATHGMVCGWFARSFWAGLALVAAAVAAPRIGVAAAPVALTRLLAHEHAHVQAGQSVPLA